MDRLCQVMGSIPGCVELKFTKFTSGQIFRPCTKELVQSHDIVTGLHSEAWYPSGQHYKADCTWWSNI